MFLIVRIFIGLLLVVSGGEKVIWPYQNFLYVLQSYELLPAGLDIFVAKVFPWVELLTGVLVLVGLWTQWIVRITLIMFAVFIVVIAQALVRGLPIEECGCFGQLIALKPQHTLLMDSFIFLSLLAALRNSAAIEKFSLDRYFHQPK